MNWADANRVDCSIEDYSKTVIVAENRKRILRAFLDIISLIELSRRNVITASHIISSINSKYQVEVSPGTIYPVLKKLEKSGDIIAIKSRKIKTYRITDKGSQRISLFQNSFVDLENTFSEALNVDLDYWAAVNKI